MPEETLDSWGWNEHWTAARNAVGDGSLIPGRVIVQERELWSIVTEEGVVSGRLRTGKNPEFVPAVGDWVLLRESELPSDPWLIAALLPRMSKFSRGAVAKRALEQVVAANVDRVWIVHGLDLEPNLRKLERFLALAWESGATPEIVLTKSDVAADKESALEAVEKIAMGVSTHIVSIEDEPAIESLRSTLRPGMTVALLGPSGVGKSTLVNRLAGEELSAAAEVRESDKRGKHTTTRRQLFKLPGGFLLIDTPGMRELQVWGLEQGLERAFPEIDALSEACRFRDCVHESEPGCAVRAGLEGGEISHERFESYRKLQTEADFQRRKRDPKERPRFDMEMKSIRKAQRKIPKHSGRKPK